MLTQLSQTNRPKHSQRTANFSQNFTTRKQTLILSAEPSHVLVRRVQLVAVDGQIAPVRTPDVDHLVHEQCFEHIEPLSVLPVAVLDGSFVLRRLSTVCFVVIVSFRFVLRRRRPMLVIVMVSWGCHTCRCSWFRR